MVANKSLVFAAVPSGLPVAGKDLVIKTTEFDTEAAPPSGGATFKVNYVSFDPYQRGRMRDASIKSYAPPFTIGSPITNRAVATVLRSDVSHLSAGDVVTIEMADTTEYTSLSAEKISAARKLNNPFNLDAKLFIGALGMPGLTAYSSLYEIGQPKKGETIFVSAASGAVGQLVGQIAKHEGLRVIGSVGDDAKLDFITKDLGFEGFNYKKESTKDALARLAPEGIDIYYENVGGETLEAALVALRERGRVVTCGMISQYNLAPQDLYGVKSLMNIVTKRLTIRGFIVGDADMGPKWYKEHQETVQKWIKDGEYKPRMSVTKGMDNAIEGLLGLFNGENFGKAVLEVAPLE